MPLMRRFLVRDYQTLQKKIIVDQCSMRLDAERDARKAAARANRRAVTDDIKNSIIPEDWVEIWNEETGAPRWWSDYLHQYVDDPPHIAYRPYERTLVGSRVKVLWPTDVFESICRNKLAPNRGWQLYEENKKELFPILYARYIFIWIIIV